MLSISDPIWKRSILAQSLIGVKDKELYLGTECLQVELQGLINKLECGGLERSAGRW